MSSLLLSTPCSTGLTSSGMCPRRQQDRPRGSQQAGNLAGGPGTPTAGNCIISTSSSLVAEGAEQWPADLPAALGAAPAPFLTPSIPGAVNPACSSPTPCTVLQTHCPPLAQHCDHTLPSHRLQANGGDLNEGSFPGTAFCYGKNRAVAKRT